MKKNRSFPEWVVPLASIALVGALALPGWTKLLDLKVLDLYTRLVADPTVRPDIALVDIDDESIQNVGQWPWSRDVHANFLGDLRSLGADTVSFDVEFVDRGPVGVSSRERDQALRSKTEELGQVFQALQSRQIAPGEASDAAQTLLQEGILLTARDNDALLGQALKTFGKAYTTLNTDFPVASADARAALVYLRDRSGIGPVSGRLDLIPKVEHLRGAIVPIAEQGAGAGVTNVDKDDDGTLRRIKLLYRLEGDRPGADRIFGQLAFVPLWVKLGRPPIEVEEGRLILRISKVKAGNPADLVIPLDSQGRMVINWPHAKYFESYPGRHVLASELQTLESGWDTLGLLVDEMQKANYLEGAGDLAGALVQANLDRSQALASGNQAAFDAADQTLADLRKTLGVLAGPAREAALKAALSAQADDRAIPAASRARIPVLLADITAEFQKFRAQWTAYSQLRTSLEGRLKGALVFYGMATVATTDIGVTPFDSVYYNVGTHASVANTILTGQFQNELTLWISFLVGALLSVAVYLLLTRMGTLAGVFVGFGLFVALMVGVAVFYRLTGTYPGALVPGLTVFATVLGLTFVKFRGTEQEKRFIRGAFGTYLSPEVIKQLEADPDRLSLGGEKKVLTAMFTDVKGFSTFSESMDPNELVKLLNGYLTEMSDLILDTKGTIDKFEGDAIIAFWGAPLPFGDHAPRAVQAALRMKSAEAAMNQRFLADGLAKTPLLTRIGINTGEMTVGNMGTARRMDYTMMGTSVNLAARLEGVNKEYGTWILTTEATQARVDEGVLFRRLDQVRVVGIHAPVRLAEVVAFREGAPDTLLDKLDRFDRALTAYDAGDWSLARQGFEAVLALDPEDGPARTFLNRTAANRDAGLGLGWDGVFTMKTK